jgi:hypothetical protein
MPHKALQLRLLYSNPLATPLDTVNPLNFTMGTDDRNSNPGVINKDGEEQKVIDKALGGGDRKVGRPRATGFFKSPLNWPEEYDDCLMLCGRWNG